MALLGRAVKDDVALLGRELTKRHVGAHAHGAADLLHEIPHEASPRQHGAVVDRDGLIGHERRLVHAAHDAGPATGRTGAGAVEGKVLGSGAKERVPARRACDRQLCRDVHGRLGVGAAVRAAVRGQAREHEAQGVLELGHGAEGRAHARHGRPLVQSERRRHVAHLVDVGAGRLGQAPARVGRERLEVAARALGVEHAEGERAFAGARDARDAHELVQGDVDVDAPQVVHARPAHLDVVRRRPTLLHVHALLARSIRSIGYSPTKTGKKCQGWDSSPKPARPERKHKGAPGQPRKRDLARGTFRRTAAPGVQAGSS